jgi:hypothetical protein
MNMANPMTSELVMYYVGKKNEELTAALTSAIWSGGWFFSGQIFKVLRNNGLDYVYIFYITGFLYLIGIFLFYRLINIYEKEKGIK